jgi:hypothetical protein
MKVADWNKWTRFKKRAGAILLLLGILISFGMEDGSISYGVYGLLVAGTGSIILSTVPKNQW